MDKSHPRIVAVDFGTKRVGLAMTDPLGMFPQPVGTFSPDDAIGKLEEVESVHRISAIVVGWPLTESGEEGKAIRRVKPFFNRLRKHFRHAEVIRQDERYTSQRAAEALVAAGVKKKDRRAKGRLDTVAAVLILQEYLQEHSA